MDITKIEREACLEEEEEIRIPKRLNNNRVPPNGKHGKNPLPPRKSGREKGYHDYKTNDVGTIPLKTQISEDFYIDIVKWCKRNKLNKSSFLRLAARRFLDEEEYVANALQSVAEVTDKLNGKLDALDQKWLDTMEQIKMTEVKQDSNVKREETDQRPIPVLYLGKGKRAPFSAAKLKVQVPVFCNLDNGAFDMNRGAIRYALERGMLNGLEGDMYLATFTQERVGDSGAPRMTSTAWAGSIGFSIGILMWVMENGRQDSQTRLAVNYVRDNQWLLDDTRDKGHWKETFGLEQDGWHSEGA